jgi:hypothetical protein
VTKSTGVFQKVWVQKQRVVSNQSKELTEQNDCLRDYVPQADIPGLNPFLDECIPGKGFFGTKVIGEGTC